MMKYQATQIVNAIIMIEQKNILILYFIKCNYYNKIIDERVTNIYFTLITMSNNGFRNLIRASALQDETFQPLLKKSDEIKKLARGSLEFIQNIYKIFEPYDLIFEQLFFNYQQELDNQQILPTSYFQELIGVFSEIYRHEKVFINKLNNNIREILELSTNLLTNYSNFIVSFQSAIKKYRVNQQNLVELGKKYYKTHKTMLGNIQLYKNSFTDVKLIYNTDQKIKRYNQCQLCYKNLNQQLTVIEQKMPIMSKLKSQIAEVYKSIQYEFVSTLKTLGTRTITLTEMFVYDFCDISKKMKEYLQENVKHLYKLQNNFSIYYDTLLNQELVFDEPIQKIKCLVVPSFVAYHKSIKQDYYPQLPRLYSNYIKDLSQKLELKKRFNKIFYDSICTFFKNHERFFVVNLKDINNTYQKNKKKISQIYGHNHEHFLKIFLIIFEMSIAANDKLMKRVNQKLKNIDSIIQQENKQVDLFIKQLKNSFEKLMKNKEMKKISNSSKNGNQEEEHVKINGENIRQDLSENSTYMHSIIDAFMEKMVKCEDQLKQSYNWIIDVVAIYCDELLSQMKLFYHKEFQQQKFATNVKHFQLEIDQIMKQKLSLFFESNFSSLAKEDQNKIVFQSQINKVQQFRKLKKPIEIIQAKPKEQIIKKEDGQEPKEETNPKPAQGSGKKINKKESIQKNEKLQKSETSSKYQEFLLSKINYYEGQRFVGTYSCGLSDKIILSGRLFITSQRLCFHSKFNPNNVFFGQTFIEIPKKDIIKIQKRQNVIIFNNSISITTVNGQIFFTSFFSRDEAFKLICQSLDISNDFMFESQQQLEFIQYQTQQAKDDDISEDELQKRKLVLDTELIQVNFITIHQSQYEYPGLNALKYFKMFETNNEIMYNRKKYQGFNMYFKELQEHKDIMNEEWTPNVTEYLNSINIKSNTPTKFTKYSKSTVPVSGSGIPLMPKHAQTEQNSSLYIYSKDKYIIETIVKNSGIPYCQYFSIYYKKIIETVDTNKCRFTLHFYINFVEKTMMRSIIQSKSIEESKAFTSRQASEMKKYLKYLQRNQKKDGKSEQFEPNSEKLSQLQKQLQQLKEVSEKRQAELSFQKKQRERYKYILVFSLVVNLLLVMLLISNQL